MIGYTGIYYLIAELSFLVLGLYAINHVKGRFPGISPAWTDGTIPIVIGILAFHLGIWLMIPNFWVTLHQEKGFVLFQLILAIGLRISTTKTKPVRILGVGVTLVGLIGFGIITFHAARDTKQMEDILSSNAPGIAMRQNISYIVPDEPLPLNKMLKRDVEEYWRGVLAPFPAQAMIRIAQEKSNFNQFERNGRNPYRGRKNGKNVGIMGINEDLWLAKSDALGESYDIYTLEGNLKMAKWMYDQEGFEPWKESYMAYPPSYNLNNGIGTAIPLPPPNAETEKIVDKFWRDNLTPEEKPEEMLQICRLESGCNQFELDGVTPLHGRINPEDIGVMQVNLYWLKKWREQTHAPELDNDPNTLDGNLKIALWIRKNVGPQAWNTWKKVGQANELGDIVVFAPVGKNDRGEDLWGAPVKNIAGTSLKTNCQIAIRYSGGQILHIDERDRFLESGVTASPASYTFEFHSMGDTPCKVVVTR